MAYDLAEVDRGFVESGLLTAGGVTAELFRRSILTALPWTSDFLWWIGVQPAELLTDLWEALRIYDATHGPDHWAFPELLIIYSSNKPAADHPASARAR